eukprot:54998-Eustigmatos_ZCMA.PRE.1
MALNSLADILSASICTHACIGSPASQWVTSRAQSPAEGARRMQILCLTMFHVYMFVDGFT